MGFFDPVAGFGVTFKTMFRKTFTIDYPNGERRTAPRFHGRHQLNRWPDGLEKCVGCELCAWACPADAIYVEGAQNTEEERFSPGERYGRVYQINYLRCILCGLCIEACPTRALTMTNEFELADDSRGSLIYEKDRLLAPLLPGMTAPPHDRELGDDEQAYFLGLPETGRADDRAGDISGARGPEDQPGLQAPARSCASRPRESGGRWSELVPLVTGAEVAFWLLAPVMVLGALGMILARKPVHSALCLAAVMISLAVQYAAQDAPFLFAVQIIVYTGAILMLFLFVLMLVGVDVADSLVETIKGQRVLAVLAGLGFGLLLFFAVGNAIVSRPVGLDRVNTEFGGNTQGLAALIFNRYVFAFEATSALLITAAVGAMVLAHRERLVPKKSQGDLVHAADAPLRRDRPAPRPAADPRRVRPAQRGGHPGAAARRVGVGALGVGHPARPRRHPRQPDLVAPIDKTVKADSTDRRTCGAPVRSRASGWRIEKPWTRTTTSCLSAILFTIGAVGFMLRRNAIVAFMCVELMLNAANLSLVTFSRVYGELDGQIAAFFVMVVAAAEVVVGLAIIVTIFRTRRSASVDDANLLKF